MTEGPGSPSSSTAPDTCQAQPQALGTSMGMGTGQAVSPAGQGHVDLGTLGQVLMAPGCGQQAEWRSPKGLSRHSVRARTELRAPRGFCEGGLVSKIGDVVFSEFT